MKLTETDNVSAGLDTDSILYVVNSPAGTPEGGKITVDELFEDRISGTIDTGMVAFGSATNVLNGTMDLSVSTASDNIKLNIGTAGCYIEGSEAASPGVFENLNLQAVEYIGLNAVAGGITITAGNGLVQMPCTLNLNDGGSASINLASANDGTTNGLNINDGSNYAYLIPYVKSDGMPAAEGDVITKGSGNYWYAAAPAGAGGSWVDGGTYPTSISNGLEIYDDSNYCINVTGAARNIYDSAGNASGDFANRQLIDSDNHCTVDYDQCFLYKYDTGDLLNRVSVDWNNRRLYDTEGNILVDYQNMELNTPGATTSIKWSDRELLDTSTVVSVNWEDRQCLESDGTTVSLDWSTQQAAIADMPTSGTSTITEIENKLNEIIAALRAYKIIAT